MNLISKNSAALSVLTTLIVCFIVSSVSVQVFGQETAKATNGKLELQTNLPGIFVADDKNEIKMEPRKYKGDLVVTKIVNEGVYVKKGDVLIEFDTDTVDEALETAQNEATDANVELQQANAVYQTAMIDLETKVSQRKIELSHLQREVESQIASQVTELAKKERGIEDAEYSLREALVDFETLKQMYDEREISTPVSADILFDREKKSITRSEKGIAVLKKELAYFMKFDKSKTQLEKELDVEKKQAEIKKEEITLRAAVAEKKAAVDKAQRKMDVANEKIADLETDRAELQVVSPRDGVLFYGTTGQEMPAGVIIMSSGGTRDVRKELRIGGRVTTHKILMTVAKMDQLSIKMSVSENDIQHLKKDLPITVYPDAFPSEHFSGKLTKVDQVGTKNRYTSSSQSRFNVLGKCTDKAPQLRSGMNCRVCVHFELEQEMVLVPVRSVFAEGDQFFCFVKNGSDVEEREVEIGFSNPSQVAVMSGLNDGEEVLLSRPNKK
ncbi:MAG: efflux RND transporter periplasmic adaptor subunit [Mariniblastus sp.]